MFGFLSNTDEDIRLNTVIMYGKFYVYKSEIYGGGKLDVYQFLVEFKNLLMVERHACMNEGKLQDKFSKWSEFYDEL